MPRNIAWVSRDAKGTGNGVDAVESPVSGRSADEAVELDVWAGTLQPGEVAIATTHETDGEVISIDFLARMASQIEANPIPINVEHVPGVNPIGWMETARVVDLADGEKGLVGKPRLLLEQDFLSPTSLAPPNPEVPSESAPDPLPIPISFDDRNLPSEAITALGSIVHGEVDVVVHSGERRYSADPIAVVVLVVVAYPFLKRLTEHLADDTYAAFKSGLAELPSQLKRPKPRLGFHYVLDYPHRDGPVQLVIPDHDGSVLLRAWDEIDSGLRAAKALLAANQHLQRVCLVWQPSDSRWGISYAVTDDFRIVCHNPVAGEAAPDGGIRTRRIVVSDDSVNQIE